MVSVIHKFFEDNAFAFEPGVLQILIAALERAWAEVLASNPLASGHGDSAKEILAMRIVETAKTGERDPVQLCRDAVAHLAKHRRPS